MKIRKWITFFRATLYVRIVLSVGGSLVVTIDGAVVAIVVDVVETALAVVCVAVVPARRRRLHTTVA